MAHSKQLTKPVCQRCGNPAKVEVFNFRNSSHGLFCNSCGLSEVARLRKEESPTRPMPEGRETNETPKDKA